LPNGEGEWSVLLPTPGFSNALTSIFDLEGEKISIYPNPISDFFILENSGIAFLQLFNSQGKEVLSQRINGNASISTETLPNGPYLLRLKSGTRNFEQNGHTPTAIIKERSQTDQRGTHLDGENSQKHNLFGLKRNILIALMIRTYS